MDYFESRARRQHVTDREAHGRVADSMEVRLEIVRRIDAGEISLEEGRAELRRIKRNAKRAGKITRNQAFRGAI